jgi:hypothetical protein
VTVYNPRDTNGRESVPHLNPKVLRQQVFTRPQRKNYEERAAELEL